MNETSLAIHSFLMRASVPFIRWCHAPCATDGEWLQQLKKKNVCAEPVCSSLFSSPDGTVLLLMHGADERGEGLAAHPAPGMEALSSRGVEKVLRGFSCSAHTLSPLSLAMPAARGCALAISEKLRQSDRLCFPCADETESVIMTFPDFAGRFVPAAGIRIVRFIQ